MTTEVDENRVRRMAKRQGLVLVKSRRRDPRAFDFGGYGLRDPRTNGLVFGEVGGRFPLAGLAEVELWLVTPRGVARTSNADKLSLLRGALEIHARAFGEAQARTAVAYANGEPWRYHLSYELSSLVEELTPEEEQRWREVFRAAMLEAAERWAPQVKLLPDDAA
jgi:hypothetical protein